MEGKFCLSSLQGLGQIELPAKQLRPVTHLLLEKGVRLALAVGLDAANVVGRGALQNLQKPLQGGLQGRRCGQADRGRLRPSAGPWE